MTVLVCQGGPRQSGAVLSGRRDMVLQFRVWWIAGPEATVTQGMTTKDRAVALGPSPLSPRPHRAPLTVQAHCFPLFDCPQQSRDSLCVLVGFRPGSAALVPPPSRPARCPGRKETHCVSSDRASGRLRSASSQPPLSSRSNPPRRLSRQPSPTAPPPPRRSSPRRSPTSAHAGAGAPRALATSTARASSCARSLTRASSTRSVAGMPGRATPCSRTSAGTGSRAGRVARVTSSSGAADRMPGSISATASRSAR